MLGKLIKYEWKNVYKVECLLLIVIFSFTLVGAVLFHTPIGDYMFGGSMWYDSDPMAFFWLMTFLSSIFMYIVIIIGAVYGSMIYLGVRFHKTMYTDEGYLSHTLPVTAHQLMGSKILVAALWSFIIECAVGASIIALVVSAMLADDPSIFTHRSDYERILGGYSMENILSDAHTLLSYGVTIFGTPFMSVTTLFGALTIGQLSKKHKGMMGIIVYFGIIFVRTVLTSIAQSVGSAIVLADSSWSDHLYLFFSIDLKLIIMASIAVGLYFLSHYIIEQKLNLN